MRRTVLLAIFCSAGACLGGFPNSAVHAHETGAELLPAFSLAPSLALPNDDPTFPLSSVNAHSSLPGAPATIYLNFTGNITTDWGISTHYSPGTTPAYDLDGDASTFSSLELSNIDQIWSRVAEMYSPFNINVTTVDPGTPETHNAVQVVIGGDGKNGADHYWYYPNLPDQAAGGISFPGAFTSEEPNTVFVFSSNLSLSSPGTPKYVAVAVAHEAGHTFGLQHQKEYSGFVRVQEYSDNNPATTDSTNPQYTAMPTAPIMGFGYLATRALWWNGQSTSSTRIQNDVGTISNGTNNFGYRPDVIGDSIIAASPLPTTYVDENTKSVDASGVIETITDKEYYSFSVDYPANVSFQVTGAQYAAMLDPSLALYKDDGTPGGQLIQLVNTASLTELLNATIDAGNYDIVVLSAGVNVGDIGQYFLTGEIVIPEPSITGGMMLLLLVGLGRRK